MIKSFVHKCMVPPNNSLLWRCLHVLLVFSLAFYGEFLIRELKKKYNKKDIILFESSSMGDVLVANQYYKNFTDIDGISDEVFIFDIRLKKIVDLFSFNKTVFISPLKLNSIVQNILITKKREIIPFYSWLIFDYRYLHKYNMALPPSTLFNKDDNLKFPENSVILSPYEQSISLNNYRCLDSAFWEALAERLISKGYSVFTNCSGSESEPCVKKTYSVFPHFDKIVQACNESSCVIAIRSGFADFAALAKNTKLICLYPNEYYYYYYGVKKVWKNDNCFEIVYDKIEYESLINTIIGYLGD